MRWIWIDNFLAFEPGKLAVAVKNVTSGEDCLSGASCGGSLFPATLMIEGMAQTAGILVGEANCFRENVILAKIRRAEFTDYAGPGDQVRYDAVLESLDQQGALASGVVRKNGTEIGRIELMFSHINQADRTGLPDHKFVFTEQFMTLLRSFRERTPIAQGAGNVP